MSIAAKMSLNGVVIDDDHGLSVLITIVDRDKPATRGSILAALREKGVDPGSITAIAPTRHFNQWIVVANSRDTVDMILGAHIGTIANKPAEVTPFSQGLLFGRFLFLPPQLGDEAPVEFLQQFGTVRKFWREIGQEEGCGHLETGPRCFILEPSPEHSADSIPQTACLGGAEVLIRIRGQQPRCYGCNLPGHQKKECGQSRPAPAKVRKSRKGFLGTELHEPTPSSAEPPVATPAPRAPDSRKGISGAESPAPAAPAPQPASPKKPQLRPSNPPTKAVTRRRAPTPSSDDSDEEDPSEELLIQKALELLPGSLHSWGEKFFSQFSDQSRAKFLRAKGKMTQDAVDAIRAWLMFHELQLHDSPRAARG